MSEIITVTGTVEEIIYSNPDNGYSVVGIDSVEEGQFTATGYMPFITEGESVALSGNWTTHPITANNSKRNIMKQLCRRTRSLLLNI